ARPDVSHLAQPVLALCLVVAKAAEARQRPAGHGDGDEDLIRARRVVHADLHAVEMRPDIGRDLVAEGNVERMARCAALLVRRHQGRTLFHRRASGLPRRGWRIAAACSSSPSRPTSAALPALCASPGGMPSALTQAAPLMSLSSAPVAVGSS